MAYSFLQMAKYVSGVSSFDITLLWNKFVMNTTLAIKEHLQHHLPLWVACKKCPASQVMVTSSRRLETRDLVLIGFPLIFCF